MTTALALVLLAPAASPAPDAEAAAARARAFLHRVGVSRPTVVAIGQSDYASRNWTVKFAGWEVRVRPKDGRVLSAIVTNRLSEVKTANPKPLRAIADRLVKTEAWHPDVRLVRAENTRTGLQARYGAHVMGLRFLNTSPGIGVYVVGIRPPGRFVSFQQEGEIPPVDRRVPTVNRRDALARAKRHYLDTPGRRPASLDQEKVVAEGWFLRSGERTARRVFAVILSGPPAMGTAYSGPMRVGATVLVDAVTGESFIPNAFKNEWVDVRP